MANKKGYTYKHKGGKYITASSSYNVYYMFGDKNHAKVWASETNAIRGLAKKIKSVNDWNHKYRHRTTADYRADDFTLIEMDYPKNKPLDCTDFEGEPISIGDEVVVATGTHSFSKGKVIGFTPKQVKLAGKHGHWFAPPKGCCKILFSARELVRKMDANEE